ncbi:Sec-independent protein translocase protein TatB [Thalassospira mesophila]|uniref:Sec-independent protein translocase protein TatB n=1 Tax=Thalassospira mesophila TaxID=1293891 RepID=UPI000A1E98E4|nr:Sec-independent protein translocase protein TatB [Thalassospira mesophila]
MFDIGWTEMALVAVVALFVVGPKDLPHVLYKMAHYWKKVRGMAREFQGGIDSLIREAELDELRKQATGASTSATDFLEKHIGGSDTNVSKPTTKKADSPSVPADATVSATSSDAVKGDDTKNSSSESSPESAPEPAVKPVRQSVTEPADIKDQPEPATARTQPEK